MNTVKAVGGAPISIGKKGEGGVTRVAFDLSEMIAAYGEGTAQLTAVRPGEEIAYAAVLTREDNAVYWNIGAEWTAYCGTGACQLSWYVGEALAKSEIFSFLVADSLETGEEAPSPSQTYLEQVQQLAVRADTAAEEAAANEQITRNATLSARKAMQSALQSEGVAFGYKKDAETAAAQVTEKLGDVGDIEAALDAILAIQNALIGGDA